MSSPYKREYPVSHIAAEKIRSLLDHCPTIIEHLATDKEADNILAYFQQGENVATLGSDYIVLKDGKWFMGRPLALNLATWGRFSVISFNYSPIPNYYQSLGFEGNVYPMYQGHNGHHTEHLSKIVEELATLGDKDSLAESVFYGDIHGLFSTSSHVLLPRAFIPISMTWRSYVTAHRLHMEGYRHIGTAGTLGYLFDTPLGKVDYRALSSVTDWRQYSEVATPLIDELVERIRELGGYVSGYVLQDENTTVDSIRRFRASEVALTDWLSRDSIRIQRSPSKGVLDTVDKILSIQETMLKPVQQEVA